MLTKKAEAIRAKAAAVKNLNLLAKAAAAEVIANDSAALLVEICQTLDNLSAIIAQGSAHGE